MPLDSWTMPPFAQSQAAIDESRRLDAPLMSGYGRCTRERGRNIAVTALPLGIASKGAQALRMGRTATALGSLASPTGYGSCNRLRRSDRGRAAYRYRREQGSQYRHRRRDRVCRECGS